MARAAAGHQRDDIRKTRKGMAAHAHEDRALLRGLCHRDFLGYALGGEVDGSTAQHAGVAGTRQDRRGVTTKGRKTTKVTKVTKKQFVLFVAFVVQDVFGSFVVQKV